MSIDNMKLNANNLLPNIKSAVVASAATITIDNAITFVSGTTNVSAIKVPAGFRGMFVILPTGAVPFVTGGTYVASDGSYETLPIKAAKTCTANEPAICVCDGNFIYVMLSK